MRNLRMGEKPTQPVYLFDDLAYQVTFIHDFFEITDRRDLRPYTSEDRKKAVGRLMDWYQMALTPLAWGILTWELRDSWRKMYSKEWVDEYGDKDGAIEHTLRCVTEELDARNAESILPSLNSSGTRKKLTKRKVWRKDFGAKFQPYDLGLLSNEDYFRYWVWWGGAKDYKGISDKERARRRGLYREIVRDKQSMGSQP